MASINWDQPFQYQGLLFPTYGLYGGLNLNSEPSPTDDLLDAAFREHDALYLTALGDEELLAASDVELLNDIMDISDANLDGEAHLYAGVTELALLYNIVVNYDQTLPLSFTKAVVADAIDNLEQASIDPDTLFEPDSTPLESGTESYNDVAAYLSQDFNIGDLLDEAA